MTENKADTKRLLSYVRRAVDDYSMIEDGDKIAVGVSGGKDSLTLLTALHGLSKFYPKHFEVRAISIDMGLPDMDFSPISALCSELGIEYTVIKTEISKIIFDVRKESNPCSLCAKMRRGALHNAAVELGCGKVALGHHFDDVTDTFMLNLFYEGRIGTFSPVTFLSRTGITVIRPLIYMPEKDIKYYVSRAGLPVVKSTCPADKNTERETVHLLLSDLDRKHKGLRYRIFGAIQRGGIDGFRETESRMRGIRAYDESSNPDAGDETARY